MRNKTDMTLDLMELVGPPIKAQWRICCMMENEKRAATEV